MCFFILNSVRKLKLGFKGVKSTWSTVFCGMASLSCLDVKDTLVTEFFDAQNILLLVCSDWPFFIGFLST